MAHISNPRYQPSGADQAYQNCPVSVDGDDTNSIANVDQNAYPSVQRSRPPPTPRTRSTWTESLRFSALYSCLQRHQKSSRYYGWKSGVLWGSILAMIVLALNITLIVVALRKDRINGIVNLYSGSVDSVWKVNLWLHIFINVCSTLLLSASNYGMQVLCAPTRSDCDDAHRKNKSLIIGMLSISNMRYISWRRKLLWTALAVSSIPLHLFYNGSIYQVEPLIEYNVKIIEPDSPDWSAQVQKTINGTLRNLTVPELRTVFERHDGSGWRDVVLVTEKVMVKYNETVRGLQINNSRDDPLHDWMLPSTGILNNEFKMNGTIQNETVDMMKVYTTLPAEIYGGSQNTSNNWLDDLDQDGWMQVAGQRQAEPVTGVTEMYSWEQESFTFQPSNTTSVIDTKRPITNFTLLNFNVLKTESDIMYINVTWLVKYFVHVSGVFAQPPLVDVSKISLNLPLILIVTISNAIKAAVLLLVLFGTSPDPPLVTIGDAICSFLERPDPYTADHRNRTQEDFLRHQGSLKKDVTPVQDLKTRWVDGSPPGSSWTCDPSWTFFSVYVIVLLAGCMTMVPVGKIQAWGTASQSRFQFTDAVDGTNAVGLSTLVNGPQLILSILYMTGNQICTGWATAREYNAFGTHPKPLRVSKPEGRQRGTRFLQLPFRWAIPMAITSGSMHWLLSQTIFLVRQDRVAEDGSWDRLGSVAACGVSGTAALVLFIVLLLAALLVGRITRKESLNIVPATGQYSWCISAACHPPADDVGTPLDAVAWGFCSQHKAQRSQQHGYGDGGVPMPTLFGSAQHEPTKDPTENATARGYSFSVRANLGPTYLGVYTEAHARWRRRAQEGSKWRTMRDFAEHLPGQQYPFQKPDQDPSWEELEPYRTWLKSTFRYSNHGRPNVPFPSTSGGSLPKYASPG